VALSTLPISAQSCNPRHSFRCVCVCVRARAWHFPPGQYLSKLRTQAFVFARMCVCLYCLFSACVCRHDCVCMYVCMSVRVYRECVQNLDNHVYVRVCMRSYVHVYVRMLLCVQYACIRSAFLYDFMTSHIHTLHIHTCAGTSQEFRFFFNPNERASVLVNIATDGADDAGMYVCMCVCVYATDGADDAGMYVCMYVCVCVRVCMYATDGADDAGMYVCMYVCVCVYATDGADDAGMCVCLCVCVCVCVCVCYRSCG
jgi:hypothetical protein